MSNQLTKPHKMIVFGTVALAWTAIVGNLAYSVAKNRYYHGAMGNEAVEFLSSTQEDLMRICTHASYHGGIDTTDHILVAKPLSNILLVCGLSSISKNNAPQNVDDLVFDKQIIVSIDGHVVVNSADDNYLSFKQGDIKYLMSESTHQFGIKSRLMPP